MKFGYDFVVRETLKCPEIKEEIEELKKDSQIQVDLFESPRLELSEEEIYFEQNQGQIQVDLSNGPKLELQEMDFEPISGHSNISDKKLELGENQLKIGKIVGNDHPEEESDKEESLSGYETKEQFILPWFLGSECECKICGEMFYYNQNLRAHIKANHGKVDDYINNFSKFESKSVYIKCELCGENMKRSQNGIKKHLNENHDELNIDVYQRQFEIPTFRIVNQNLLESDIQVRWKFLSEFKKGSCKYQCKKCNFLTLNGDNFWSHVKSKHGFVEEDYTKVYGDPWLLKNKLTCMMENCFEPILHDYSEMCKHLAKVHGSIEIEEFFRLHYQQPTTYDEWKDQCEYQCKICSKQFNNISSILQHIRDHKISISDYKAKYGDYATKRVLFKCPICQKEINWQNSSLNEHAKHTHKMSLRQFYYEHVKKDSGRIVRPQIATKQTENVTESKAFREWKNQCEYECKICSKFFYIRRSCANHINEAHKINVEEYKAKYGDYVTKNVLFTCPLCEKDLVWESYGLKQHFTTVHKMSLRQYYDENVKNDSDGIQSENVTKKMESFMEPKAFREWKNQCEYECKICLKKFQIRRSISNHIIEVHKIYVEEYKAKYGDYSTKNVLFNCSLCEKELVWDSYVLNQHFTAVHKMSLRQFFDKYVHKSLVSQIYMDHSYCLIDYVRLCQTSLSKVTEK